MLYKKKPVVVEAVIFDKAKWNEEIAQAKLSESFPMVLLSVVGGFSPVIPTLEGDMTVSDGDYIIKGVQGEFYPCKPDIFEATYEEVGGKTENKNTLCAVDEQITQLIESCNENNLSLVLAVLEEGEGLDSIAYAGGNLSSCKSGVKLINRQIDGKTNEIMSSGTIFTK